MNMILKRFYTSQFFRNIFLIFLGIVFLGSFVIYFTFRYQKFQLLNQLKTLSTAKEVEIFLKKELPASIREIGTAKLAELLMKNKDFEKARFYLNILRKTASSKELRFRASCDYAISFSFCGQFFDALQALKEIETYSGVIPETKRYKILFLLAIESLRCGDKAGGKQYLQKLCFLPVSADLENEEVRKKALTMLENLNEKK